MSNISYAMKMAKKYHEESKFNHVIRVATYVSENGMIPSNKKDFCFELALMHDLLEDTDYPRGALSGMNYDGFIKCMELLTKAKEEDYITYIKRIKDNSDSYPEAYWVKLADMKDHLAQTETLTDKLKDKYLKALPYLL